MSPQEHCRAIQQRQQAANLMQRNDDTSTIGPPTAVDVGTRQMNQANQQTQQTGTDQASQQQAPGSMLRAMMSNAAARSQSGINDEISVNGTTCRRVSHG